VEQAPEVEEDEDLDDLDLYPDYYQDGHLHSCPSLVLPRSCLCQFLSSACLLLPLLPLAALGLADSSCINLLVLLCLPASRLLVVGCVGAACTQAMSRNGVLLIKESHRQNGIQRRMASKEEWHPKKCTCMLDAPCFIELQSHSAT